MRRRRGLEVLAAGLVMLAATVIVTWPLAGHLTTRVSGHWDSYFSVWRLAWIADAIASEELRLFDAPIFYPQPRALALSDAVILPGVAAAPLRYAGLQPAAVYNIVLFAAFATSGAAMFLLVRSLTGRADAAIIAGVVYTIAPYRLHHLDHLEMQMAAFMPASVWLWHRAVDRASPGAAGAAVIGGVLQWLSCIYYGVLFAPVFLTLMAVEWGAIPRGRRLGVARGLAAAAAVGVIVIAAYSWPYLANREGTGDRSTESVARYSATVSSYLAVSDHNPLYARWLAGYARPEAVMFPGAAAVILAAAGIAAGPWTRRRVAYVAAGLVAFDLSLGANGLLFPVLREWLLPFRGLRAPARAGVIVLLVISALAGSGAAILLSRLRRSHAALATAGLVLVLLVEYRTPPDLWEAPPPAHQPEFGFAPGTVVVEMPMAPPDRLDVSRDAEYMMNRIGAWPSLVNGYSGHYPGHYILFASRVQGFPDDRAIREMARAGVDLVTVHERWYGERFAGIVKGLDARSDVEKVGDYVEGENLVAVYKVIAGPR
jgi:hypothetical protein